MELGCEDSFVRANTGSAQAAVFGMEACLYY
jgi:hypothetical protein